MPGESTAFPYRDSSLLLAPVIVTSSAAGDRALDRKAERLGEDLRQILLEGSGRSELRAYVNYAFGEESPQDMYGHEQWRQDRLRAIKDEYDPKRKFSFYAPIA